ncbi:MAG: DUF4280 domain-containing protein [Muribaculaceae bacterium]|nr:DUF4280 domain-containing protein [Muribaculaceae bacterium]
MSFDSILKSARSGAKGIQSVAKFLKIELPTEFPEEIVKLNDCLDTYSSVKTMVSTVVSDATGLRDLSSWASLTGNFDKNWDAFAKEYNEIFNRANKLQKENILETFAKDHFGENIFEAASIIKNSSADILTGITGFKGGVNAFKGSYRNPVEAANKITQGVSAIVNSVQKVSNSVNNILKFIEKKRGIESPGGSVILSQLGSLTSKRPIGVALSGMNIATGGLNAFASGNSTINALKQGDLKATWSAGYATYKNIKGILSEVKNLKKKLGPGGVATGGAAPISFNSDSQEGETSGMTETALAAAGAQTCSYVCSTGRMRCTNGDQLSTLTVLPLRTIWLWGQPQANISDHISIVNIAPFGKCHTVAFPPTGAATSANHGKLTPMPCIPNTPFPWMNGKNDVLLQGQPALLDTSKLQCIYGGTITITFNGQNPK